LLTKKHYGVDETTKGNRNLSDEVYQSKIQDVVLQLARKFKHFDEERKLIKLLNNEAEIDRENSLNQKKIDFKKEALKLKIKVHKGKGQKGKIKEIDSEIESEIERDSESESLNFSRQEFEEMRVEVFEQIEMVADRTRLLEAENKSLKDKVKLMEKQIEDLAFKILILSGAAHDRSERK